MGCKKRLGDSSRLLKAVLKGRYPKRIGEVHLAIKSRRSVGFNKKILERMAKDRNPNLKMFADKLRTRDFVASIGLDHILPAIYWSGTNEIELLNLLSKLNSFVLKPSLGSGAIIICWDGFDEGQSKESKDAWSIALQHPNKIDLRKVVNTATSWLQIDYSNRIDSFREWAYSSDEKRIFVEEVLVDVYGRLPRDYKLFIFHGTCRMIQVDYDRFNEHTRAFYSPDWERMSLQCIYPQASLLEDKPPQLAEMIEISEAIAGSIDFLRVDLYITDKGIKFGECTVYPGGGIDKFEPTEMNLEIGSFWMTTS